MTRETCGAATVFWPDVEGCEAVCFLPLHDGTIHQDEILGEWDTDDMYTWFPQEETP